MISSTVETSTDPSFTVRRTMLTTPTEDATHTCTTVCMVGALAGAVVTGADLEGCDMTAVTGAQEILPWPTLCDQRAVPV